MFQRNRLTPASSLMGKIQAGPIKIVEAQLAALSRTVKYLVECGKVRELEIFF